MKILLSYSKAHFDPDKKPAEQKYWGSSASILARTLYKILSGMGTLTYIDAQNPPDLNGKSFDLFVGIYTNYQQILQSCKIKRSLFFAVNMHPEERNRVLLSFVRDNKIPWNSVASWDILDNRLISQAIDLADGVMLVGNITTYNSYLKNGVPAHKIKAFNYGLDVEPAKKPTLSVHKAIRFLYVSSEIGLRKGFDILCSCLTSPRVASRPFHLDIIGTPNNKAYEEKLEALQKKLGSKITYHGWVESQSTQYKSLLKEADFLLYPAIEEGQAGAVIDTLAQGVIPIISINSGFDFSPLGTFELKLDSERNNALLELAMNLSPSELNRLKTKTLEYYNEYHRDFSTIFSQALKRFADTGTLHPKVSIILPVYNKQATIRSLIGYVNRACKAYRNVELDVIFDGCKDKTESIVRSYFAKKPFYPVRLSTTPNIFEVKSNNLGLKRANGEYAVIVQDDNFIYDQNFLFEATMFLDNSNEAVVLGGLAGVNYYPRGTKNLHGAGQIAMTDQEVYWRQDANTDPQLQYRTFQVDACMRGPLFFRISFLKKYGYLDEIYAPLYQDDMDICFRAKSKGYKVYCMLMNVENKSLTMAHYDAKRNQFFVDIIKRNTDIFYKRWKPTATINKDYSWINRVAMWRKNDLTRSSHLRRWWLDKSIGLQYGSRRFVRRASNALQLLKGKIKPS